jgi:hypothetical protein
MVIYLSSCKSNSKQAIMQRIFTSNNGLKLPMDLNSKHSAGLIHNITLKARQEGHNNKDPKLLLIFLRFYNPFSQHFNNPILQTHKKLIFNINEILSIGYQLQISIVNGAFMLVKVETNAPFRSRT